MHYDIFNGDADGLCALIQLRLAKPLVATLITGIKRDIQLLKKITAGEGDSLTVLDISLDKNSDALQQFLTAGATVFYADHHQADHCPTHKNLTALIDTDANTCTSLIVNKYLNGQYPLWAIVAAFGDNLYAAAEILASSLGLNHDARQQLKKLGLYINYNAYGGCIEDLHFKPEYLYEIMRHYSSPLTLIDANAVIFNQLEQGYQQDLAKALAIKTEYENEKVAVYILDDAVWARRVNGVFANNLANQHPDKAHAIITYTQADDYQVSVRAPLNNKINADILCAAFPTGGGRKGAAGINHLAKNQLSVFIEEFSSIYTDI